MNIENLSVTISDIYEQDIQLAYENINQEPIGFWRRSLIRLLISLFESEVFLLKSCILTYCNENNIVLKPEKLLTLQGKKYTLGNNGRLKEEFMMVKLADDIKFTFLQLKDIRNFDLAISFEDNGWNNLKETIKIRNRITHPKSLEDQKISADEVETCMSGRDWFYSNHINFMRQHNEFLEHKISTLERILNKPNSKKINLLGGGNF